MPDFTRCPRCKSFNLVRQTGEHEHTSHYGRLKCGDCSKHIEWLKDPSVCMRHTARVNAIDSIVTTDHSASLTPWERQFLQSVRECRKLSPKQSDRLNAIALKTLKVRICASEEIPPIKNPLGRVGDERG